MNKMTLKTLLLMLLISIAGNASPRSEEELAAVGRRMLQLDGYSYRIETVISSTDTHAKASIQYQFGYSSFSDAVRWSGGAGMVTFSCRKGYFIVDSASRKIRYHLYAGGNISDQELEQVRRQSTAYLDSMFSLDVRVEKKSLQKGIARYVCSYPDGRSLQRMEVDVAAGRTAPERLSCTYLLPVAPFAPIGMQQKVTLSQYVKKIPDAVKKLLAASAHLEQYLKTTYPSYELIKS